MGPGVEPGPCAKDMKAAAVCAAFFHFVREGPEAAGGVWSFIRTWHTVSRESLTRDFLSPGGLRHN